MQKMCTTKYPASYRRNNLSIKHRQDYPLPKYDATGLALTNDGFLRHDL